MNLSGLKGEVCVIFLRNLRVKVSKFRSKFMKFCEWFEWCDR